MELYIKTLTNSIKSSDETINHIKTHILFLKQSLEYESKYRNRLRINRSRAILQVKNINK